MTSVSGHMLDLDFGDGYRYASRPCVVADSHALERKWSQVHPLELFDAPVIKKEKSEARQLVDNIKAEARRCQVRWQHAGDDSTSAARFRR